MNKVFLTGDIMAVDKNGKCVISEDDELILNARKPVGELGDQLLNRMNKSHEALAQWGVSHLDIEKEDIILDIGCGGGVNVERFLKMTDGMVYGLDYSEVSVEKTSFLNKSAIDSGKCEVIQGSVSELPFDDMSFDIVTAFETIMFWPDIVADLKEVRRVLKDEGIVFICNEAVPDENNDRLNEVVDLLDMKLFSEDDLDYVLREAGFSDVICFRKTGYDWICAIAIK